MLRFKETGIQRYDWGGLFEDESTPERAGINNFKRDFGGQQERIYDCTVPVTIKGRIYLAVRDAWRRRTSVREFSVIFQRQFPHYQPRHPRPQPLFLPDSGSDP